MQCCLMTWCASRVLTKAEKNYFNIEQEALSIIFGMKRFSSYLSGKHFTVITDHRPLKYIFDTSTVVSDRISAQLQRWAYVIRSFDFDVTTITGEHILSVDFQTM